MIESLALGRRLDDMGTNARSQRTVTPVQRSNGVSPNPNPRAGVEGRDLLLWRPVVPRVVPVVWLQHDQELQNRSCCKRLTYSRIKPVSALSLPLQVPFLIKLQGRAEVAAHTSG